MRWIVLFAVLPLLGACNYVTTAEPLFTAADAAGAPALRDGLWISDNSKCRVDTRKPVQRWPKCAAWGLVRGGELLVFAVPEKGKPAEWRSSPFLLAAGNPRIMQFSEENTEPEGKSTPYFTYAGLIATANDAEGRITAYRMWLVQCGPPAKDNNLGRTDAPFPGLTLNMPKGDDETAAGCTTDDPQALRAAAAASQALDAPWSSRWVRDTLP